MSFHPVFLTNFYILGEWKLLP